MMKGNLRENNRYVGTERINGESWLAPELIL